MDSLKQLRERVKAAKGQDDKLEYAIYLQLREHTGLQSFTASTDAALALVERVLPSATYAVDASAPECGIDVDLFLYRKPGEKSDAYRGTAGSLPLAILAALLTALIAQKENQG